MGIIRPSRRLQFRATHKLETHHDHAGSLMPVYGMSNDVLINRPDTANGFTTICYGCTSNITGLPRTEYVRPHYNSGRYVDGYFRSRR